LDEALNSVWTLLATSLGAHGIYAHNSNEPPLYQAIIVWLANCAIFMTLATHNRHPHGSHAVQYTAIAQMHISMVGILYLWARADARRGVR
jgi:hypothetical protein